MDGHYKTDVISGVDHRAASVTYSMMCNGWGTSIVL
jgi:hypothetical protein